MAAVLQHVDPAPLRNLLDAARRACDHWGDSPAARQAMEQECRAVPPHQRSDLIQNFKDAYP